MTTVEQRFPSDHPAAQGHFPGNPIIPGALLLSETLRAAERSLGVSLSSCRIRSAKFLSPARPGDRVVMEFSRSGENGIRFTCTVGGKAVLSGEAAFDAVSRAG